MKTRDNSESALSDLLGNMPVNFRYRWCESVACCCLGCCNRGNLGLEQNGFTKKQWLEWLENNPDPVT